MKKLGNFGPTSELPRQVQQLELNAEAAIAAAGAGALPAYAPTGLKTVFYAAKVDELVTFDTTVADGTLVLPIASPDNAGHRVGVIRRSASHTLKATVAKGTVQGATTDTMPTTVGRYEYVSDGIGWWR